MQEVETHPVVVVAEPIATIGLAELAEHAEVVDAVGTSRAELVELLRPAHGLLVRSATVVDADLIAAAPLLQVIGRAGIGVDNIDLAAATAAGVLVVNAPAANVISAAEHTMALILSQARNVPRADATLRSGVWDRKSFEGIELHGKTLGVIGLGRVGTLVAQRAHAFGMSLLAYDPFVGHERARRIGVELTDDLDRIYANADVITIHLPKTKETEGLIGKEALEKMRVGVLIVNTSRGGIIDEAALAEAVRSGRVAGAALDVFTEEPLGDSPLLTLPQIVLTPHLGASTVEAQDKAGVDVARSLALALRGELVLSAVNVDLGPEVADEVRSFLPLVEQLGRVFVALARGIPDRVAVRAEGRIAEYPVRPLGLAALKGALAAVSTVPVTYVNASPLAAERGINLVEEADPEARDFVSLVRLSGETGGRPISVSGTLGRKGPILVEILDHEVELPLSPHMAVLRNADVPGMIGRVGTYLGGLGVNIANMVVGRTPETGAAAMMGLNLDQALTDEQVEGLLDIDGIEEAVSVALPG
jgi:D-3-phosphoglycerate dehydrogenase